MFDWIITFALLLGCVGFGVYANWKAGQPWDDMKPRVVPWRLVLIGCGFAGILVLVHLANLFGVETGPENSPFGRF